MQVDTVQKTADDTTSSGTTGNNIGVWEGYLSSGPTDLPASGTQSGGLYSGDKGSLTVNYDDRSFTYKAADGTITTGTIDKTFPLGGAANTSLGGGTLAFTDEQGKLWIFSQNAAAANSRWTYYATSGGILVVVATNPGSGSLQLSGSASSDLWYSEQKYAVQPPPVGIIKWTGYMSGGPIQLNGTSQTGPLVNTDGGTLFIDYPNRRYTYQATDGTQTTGTINQTFLVDGGSSMSIGVPTLAFTDDQGQLWIFTQNPPGANARWNYIPTSSGDILNLVTKTASGNATVQTSGKNTTDLWYDARKYGTSVSEVCYLPGTLIATPQGHRAIETLNAGDEIFVLRKGAIVSEKIIWSGSGVCTTRMTPHKDLAGFPVRIKAGALGDALPHEDLLVTSEHCLYLDGGLIPARMLVNGHSITYEETLSTYSYHHIELERHGLIFANGALSESFLDTGNRIIFGFQTTLPFLAPSKGRTQSWQQDAAAPLTTDQSSVEPVWRRLAALCGTSAGNDHPPCPSEEIALETLDGRTILPSREHEDGWVFRFHPKGQAVYLRARTRRPCDTIGPFLDDRRELGILVKGIQVFTPENCLDIHPNSISGTRTGWHEIEAQTQRWTKSKALIPLGKAELNGPVVVFISATTGRALQTQNRHAL
ncbi:Hint domain-containing protein [Asaia spathodeae]|uniref:Hint domain-containing protein n=1 Tax=Asaia spathodeae TaxID=657016 RepID=UPI002156D356|nr:Hint domain-containing protein [Asaia spathodeae]GBR14901.1 hypothetical protein AA105894_1198 [Asaia spathodeae NBRC 105894]